LLQLGVSVIVKRFVSLQFLNLTQSVGLLGRGINPSQGFNLFGKRDSFGDETEDEKLILTYHLSWKVFTVFKWLGIGKKCSFINTVMKIRIV
jgi:hypothetical protein